MFGTKTQKQVHRGIAYSSGLSLGVMLDPYDNKQIIFILKAFPFMFNLLENQASLNAYVL